MLILAFSDGRDTASWTRADQALALARSSDAVVDAVVAGELRPASTVADGGGDMLAPLTPDERFLADLAAQTGGRVRNGEAGAGLAARSATPSSSSAAATRSATPRPPKSRAGTPSRCACPADAAPASTPDGGISAEGRTIPVMHTLVLVARLRGPDTGGAHAGPRRGGDATGPAPRTRRSQRCGA